MLARLLVAAASLLALAPSALAATPAIHAQRGGTVVNGTPRFAEESIRAYRQAARHGFVLEVDAKLTEDGVPVALHDATLERNTNCAGELRTFTLAELRACRTDVLGSPGSPLPTRRTSRREPIPTIAELLSFARLAGARVNLEIKNVPGDPDFDPSPDFADRVMDVVLASRIPRSQLLIQSFIASSLDEARARMPGVATSLLSVQSTNEPYLQTAAANGYDFISPEWPVSDDYVSRAHGLGLDVAPFTLDRAADVRAASRAGVEAVITDDPLMAAGALNLHPLRRLDASAFIAGRRLVALGHMRLPAGVAANDGCRGRAAMRVMTPGGRLLKTVRGRVLAGCEFRFSTRRPPRRVGVPLVTILFAGNRVLLPRLDGPERAAPKAPNLQP